MIICKEKGSVMEVQGSISDIASDIMTVTHYAYVNLLEEDEKKAEAFKQMIELGLGHCLCTTEEAVEFFENDLKKEKESKKCKVLKELADLMDDDEIKKSIDELIELMEDE